MGDPITTGIALQAGSAIFGGLGGAAEAKSQKRAAEINSYIGRTRAIQTDTAAREGLDSELATMRATFAANHQKAGVGTFEIFKELRDTRGRERRVEVANRNQEAADYRTQAKNYGSAAKNSVLGGFIKAGPSLFDFYERKKT